MRGTAFIGGEGPSPDAGIDIGFAGGVCVAADSGLAAAERWGIRPDWIVGDMDSLEDLSSLSDYPADRIRRYPADKDYTDTELALSLLLELGCGEIRIIGGGGGRLDHILAISALFERESPPDRWTTAKEEIFCIDGRRREGRLAAEAEKGALVSLFPVGAGPWSVESSGLKWPLGAVSWRRGSFGISNVAEDGRLELEARSGRFLAILPIGTKIL